MSTFRKKTLKLLRHLRFFYFPLMLCYLELITHTFAYRSFNRNISWVIFFSLGLGCLCSFFTSVFSRRINAILTYLFSFAVTLVFSVQLVYFQIFKGFAPVSAVKLGGQAVTNFTGGMFEGIRSAAWWLVLLFIPFLLLVVFGILLRPKFNRPAKFMCLYPMVASAVILCGTVGVMAYFFSGIPSIYRTFSSSSTSTDTSIKYFGLNMTVIQETKGLLFPEKKVIAPVALSTSEVSEEAQVDSAVDFKALYNKAGDNETLKNLTAQLSNMPTTQKHEYTGICEGYNLISICAEAFSPEFIDPKLTPTLYKLSTNGFVFDNFYATFPNTTTNGEYAFCMGLFPDLSREKTDSSFGVSATNYLPYCYGNLFGGIGANAYAYHNYVAEFYYRNFTHPNMGYEFTAANSGLDIDISWPSSDYDMMVASVDDYIDSGEQFVAYYMTFSGHYQYTLDNAMSAKNWETVKDLPYSDGVKAYIACNLELERALTYLMERLEAAGIADKTVITLTADHYPYGLTDKEYAELSGRKIANTFDKQKNSFICYVPNLSEPIHVDSYCCTVDILPTMLNLFGFTYDSRLLAGQDILAPDAEHIAIIADGSYIADGVRYNSSIIRYQFDEGSDISRERAEELYLLAEKKLEMSTEILYNDYYSFVYDKKSDSAAIDNLTEQYTDVGIMSQSAVYYMLKYDIMSPLTENSFGVSTKATVIEVIDGIYRAAGRPEIITSSVDIPFSFPEEYTDAVAWCRAVGILIDDDLFGNDLSRKVRLKQLALLTYRTAEYYGTDTSLDEAEFAELSQEFRHIDERLLRALMFCRDSKIMTGDGDEEYVFTSADSTKNRKYVANTLYRLCSYYIFKDRQ